MAREDGTLSNPVTIPVPGQMVVVPVIIPLGELGIVAVGKIRERPK